VANAIWIRRRPGSWLAEGARPLVGRGLVEGGAGVGGKGVRAMKGRARDGNWDGNGLVSRGDGGGEMGASRCNLCL
jgi:hypothetical protein